jgi:hypothetical protein
VRLLALLIVNVEDRQELTQRDRSNLTHPQGYLMVASPVDIS